MVNWIWWDGRSTHGIWTFCGCWFLLVLSSNNLFGSLYVRHFMLCVFLCASSTCLCHLREPGRTVHVGSCWVFKIYWKSQLWAQQPQWSTAAAVKQLVCDWFHCARYHKQLKGILIHCFNELVDLIALRMAGATLLPSWSTISGRGPKNHQTRCASPPNEKRSVPPK